MTFEAWYAAVDAEFIKVTGLDRDSWPDSDYYSHYEDGLTPHEAVTEAIEEEYGPMGLDAFGLEA